jgi:hypothetical protein
MEYFTNQNDLNKLDSISPKKPDDSENRPKFNVLDVFVMSILKVKKLVDVSVTNSSKFVSYVVFISILAAMMSFAVPIASRITTFGGFNNLFTNVMPNVKVSDGALIADKKFEMNLSTSTILIDTSKREFNKDDFDKSGVYLAFGKRKMKLVSYAGTEESNYYNEIYSLYISNYFPEGFSNSDLVSAIPLIYIFLVITFVMVVTFDALKFLIIAGVFSIIFRGTTSILKVPMTLKNTYHLCFYAQTISIILTSANNAIGYFVFPTLLSIICLFITGIVIRKALKPHMPDIDEIIDKFKGGRF